METGSELKTSVIIGFALFLSACTQTESKHALTYVEIIGEDRGLSGAVDTIQQLRHHSERDTLVGQCVFAYFGTDHIVRAWRDDHYQPVDGGSFWLELDSMGAIYSHSTAWPGFFVIHTNNDSINALIAMAIGAASRPAHFGIRDPLPRTPSIETVQFTAVDSAVDRSP